jgi:hypothetical protein
MANKQIEALKTALINKQAPPKSSSVNTSEQPILLSTIAPSDRDDDLLSPGNLDGIASFLQLCPDPVTLQLLRKVYPPEALTAAARVLRQQDAEAFDRIKQWRQEQDRGHHCLPEVKSHIRGAIAPNVPSKYCAAWKAARNGYSVFVLEEAAEDCYWVVVVGENIPFTVPKEFFVENL